MKIKNLLKFFRKNNISYCIGFIPLPVTDGLKTKELKIKTIIIQPSKIFFTCYNHGNYEVQPKADNLYLALPVDKCIIKQLNDDYIFYTTNTNNTNPILISKEITAKEIKKYKWLYCYTTDFVIIHSSGIVLDYFIAYKFKLDMNFVSPSFIINEYVKIAKSTINILDKQLKQLMASQIKEI